MHFSMIVVIWSDIPELFWLNIEVTSLGSGTLQLKEVFQLIMQFWPPFWSKFSVVT